MRADRKKIVLRLLTSFRYRMGSRPARSLAAALARGVCLSLLVAGCAHNKVQVPTPLVQQTSMTVPKLAKRAYFGGEYKTRDTQRMADWVVDSGDNRGLPFAIVDKKEARLFVFYPDGRLRGTAPVLLGLAKGDVSPPDIGQRKLADVKPEERTTPAGRFVAAFGNNFHGKDVLWVDYEGAVSMHRVVTGKPEERRFERLSSPTHLDNRISYGCINVPVEFFDNVVRPSFLGTNGIVYVLPETRSNKEIFVTYYDVD